MRIPIHLVIALVCYLACLEAYARCDDCPQPAIGVYDFDVTVPPVSLQESKDWEYWNWTQLFRIAHRAGAVLSNSDTACIRFLAGAAFQDTSGVPSQNPLVVGLTNPILPPSGSLQGMDYVFTGRVETEGQGYRATMALEGACSRKPLVSRAFTFTDPEEGLEIARAVAEETFGSLFSTIRDQERKLRDSDTTVAICVRVGEGLVISPAKSKAEPFEKVLIQFSLNDCDGEPLPGRVIHLDSNAALGVPPSHNGSFDVASVTTDAAGKAEAYFTLGGGRDVAVPRAWFEYNRPSGCVEYTMDEALILVDGTAKYYEVQFELEQYRREQASMTMPLPGGQTGESRTAHQSTIMRCRGYWRNSDDARRSGEIELSGEPEFACNVVGQFDSIDRNESLTQAYEASSGPGLTDSSMEILGRSVVRVAGEPIAGRKPDLYFTIDPNVENDSAQFSLSVPFRFSSSSKIEGLTRIVGGGTVIETPESDESENSWESDLNADTPNMEFVSKEFLIEITSEFDTTERDGDAVIQRSGKLRAVIRPFL